MKKGKKPTEKASGYRPWPHSIRLTLGVKGGDLTVKDASKFRMRAPKGEDRPEVQPDKNLIGQWVEIRAKDRTLYRRFVEIPSTVEIPSGTADGIRRVSAKKIEQLVHIVIPAIDQGEELVIVEHPRPAKKGAAIKPRELLHIPIKDDNQNQKSN